MALSSTVSYILSACEQDCRLRCEVMPRVSSSAISVLEDSTAFHVMLGVFTTLGHLNATVQIGVNDGTWGGAFTKYISPYGTLKIKEHRLLTRMFPGEGVMLIVDPEFVGSRTMVNGDTKVKIHEPNADTNFTDAWEFEYRTEKGLWVALPQAHGWLEGVTSAATS